LIEVDVYCLCGENGAGKSTLIKILSGAHLPDQGGEIYFEGEKVKLTPHYAMELGIQTIYQEHIVFPHLSIVENIFSGMEIHKHGLVQKKEMIKKTSEVLTYLDSNLDPESLVGDLSQRQRLNIS
jgi:ABC-type sugar transport system ATPase subunit